jgi:hypothetical protein
LTAVGASIRTVWKDLTFCRKSKAEKMKEQDIVVNYLPERGLAFIKRSGSRILFFQIWDRPVTFEEFRVGIG